MVNRAPRLLVKCRPLPAGTPFALNNAPFELQPLFPDEHSRASMAAEPEAQWHIAEVREPGSEADAWDLCHKLHRSGFGMAGGPDVEFAEPDVVQQWPTDSQDRLATQAFAAANGAACDAPNPPNKDYPRPDPYDWRWYQGDDFSGLNSARSEIQVPADRITIAHLDTGLVAPGKNADFIVLDANPLDDITNTRRISAVYLRGAQVDRAAMRARWTSGS